MERAGSCEQDRYDIGTGSRSRLEKGKGRARGVSELPEVVWRRIFEHYYDLTASGESRSESFNA